MAVTLDISAKYVGYKIRKLVYSVVCDYPNKYCDGQYNLVRNEREFLIDGFYELIRPYKCRKKNASSFNHQIEN